MILGLVTYDRTVEAVPSMMYAFLALWVAVLIAVFVITAIVSKRFERILANKGDGKSLLQSETIATLY